MKNMFGSPKKRTKYTSQIDKNSERLEKYIRLIEIKLERMESLYETTLLELKKTESQNSQKELKQDEKIVSEDFETINHDEETTQFNEPEYIILPEPNPQRQISKDILEKEAVKEVHSNRREIIKKKIIDELRKRELSAKELKILFVNEYNYCSKATFYRYLEALRKEERIDSIKINGKEYLCSIPSKINNRNL